MDNSSKLKLFEESLEEMADKEYAEIKKDVDKQISDGISEELKEYEAKKKASFEKSSQKIEKEFNKKVYNYEIQCKKDLIEEEKRLKKGIKEDAAKLLAEFTNNPKYKDFLINTISNSKKMVDDMQNTYIGITKKDKEKYEKEISETFAAQIKEISEDYIGGCILENEKEGIFIDNTLLNYINEKLKD